MGGCCFLASFCCDGDGRLSLENGERCRRGVIGKMLKFQQSSFFVNQYYRRSFHVPKNVRRDGEKTAWRRGEQSCEQQQGAEKVPMAVVKDKMPPPSEEEKPVMDTSDDDGTDSSLSQASSSDEESNNTYDFRNATEWANFVAGVCLLVLTGPPVGVVIFAAMVWEALDRGFDGGFVDSGRELTGFLFGRIVPWLTHSTQKFNERFVKRPDDAYMMNCIFAYGVLIPLLFFACAYNAYQSETRMTSLWVVFFYHLIRIGPYFMNFAYVSLICGVIFVVNIFC